MDKANREIGKLAVKLELIDVEQAQEGLRILEVRQDIGEPGALDQILYERGYLSADDVYELQCRLKQRLVFCPDCDARHDVFQRRPGSKFKCTQCRTRFRIPGEDRDAPFEVPAPEGRPELEQGLGAHSLGLLGIAALGALFAAAALQAWGNELRWPVLGTAAAFLAVTAYLGRQKQLLAAAGAGLALFTGLVLAVAIGNQPGFQFLSDFGTGISIDAHRLVGPLVVFHLVVLALMVKSFLGRLDSPWLFLVILIPLCYGFLFFVSRCIPGTGVTHVVSGPGVLTRVPWFLHPGVLTLLLVFPLAALVLAGGGLRRLVKQEAGTLLRDGGLIASLLLLTAFGLAVGSLSEVIPQPALRTKVDGALAGRTASWAGPAEKQPVATTAVAIREQR